MQKLEALQATAERGARRVEETTRELHFGQLHLEGDALSRVGDHRYLRSQPLKPMLSVFAQSHLEPPK
jgi:hypothetical protein